MKIVQRDWRGGLEMKRTRVQFTAPTPCLTTTFNSIRGSRTLFQLLWAPGMHMVHRHVCRQNAHVQIDINLNNNNKTFRNQHIPKQWLSGNRASPLRTRCCVCTKEKNTVEQARTGKLASWQATSGLWRTHQACISCLCCCNFSSRRFQRPVLLKGSSGLTGKVKRPP